jgi:hypothetical protein
VRVEKSTLRTSTGRTLVKGSQKPKKPLKKAAQKTLKERRVEKKAAEAERSRTDRA